LTKRSSYIFYLWSKGFLLWSETSLTDGFTGGMIVKGAVFERSNLDISSSSSVGVVVFDGW
jgi:hypothetical protein